MPTKVGIHDHTRIAPTPSVVASDFRLTLPGERAEALAKAASRTRDDAD